MENLKLSNAEEELMDLFWKEDRPLTSVEILELSSGKSWSGKYLHKMLKSLEKQGLIGVCGTLQYGSQYARRFKTLMTSEEYTAKSIVSKSFFGNDIAKIAVALVKETNKDKIGEEDDKLISDLEKMIDELKSRKK